MSKLLIEEYPLILLPTLAKEIGLYEAIVLQQVHYWIHHKSPEGKRYGKVVDDKRWIRNTVKQWQEENFPFLSEGQIYRAIKSLEEMGLLLSRDDLNKMGYDRTKWYTIDYSILHQREMHFPPVKNGTRASEDTIPETTTETTTDINDKEEKHNIFKLYEQNIGVINPMMADKLKEAENRYPPSWIEPAIEIAVEANARNWRYIETILQNWEVHGYGWKPGGNGSGKQKKDERSTFDRLMEMAKDM